MGRGMDGPEPNVTTVPEWPYALWDRPTPPTPPRSRLYSLEPIGVGTGFVESLTGYLSRLAEAHQVHLSMLVARVCAPEVGYASLNMPGKCGLSTVWTSAPAMNGLQKVARDWVRVLERLTARQDLRFLTWLPWAEVLDHKQLIRATRAWCPACFADWRGQPAVVYEPLLWAAASVQRCPRHHARLVERCPHPGCGRPQLWLGARFRPGHCARCHGWLGGPAEPDGDGADRDSPGAQDRDAWRANAIAELLALAPSLDSPPARGRVQAGVDACVRMLTGGNIDAFARLVRLHAATIRQWHKGGVPRLDSLLELTSRLGISPRQFLSGDVRAVRAPDPAPQGHRRTWCPDRLSPRRSGFDTDGVRRALEAALASDEDPPPSLCDVARRVGISRSAGLYRRFPDLCRVVAARHRAARRVRTLHRQDALREEVRRVVAALHAEGQYPSCNLVRARLSHPAAFRNAIVQEAWVASLREHGWEKGPQGRGPLGPSGHGTAPREVRQLDWTVPPPGGS